MTSLRNCTAALLAAITLSVVLAGRTAAEPMEPNTADYTDCLSESIAGGADAGCEGALCWCCYSNGCWICNNKSASNDRECEWEGRYRSELNPLLLQHLPSQTFTTQPSGPGQLNPAAPAQR